MNRDDIRKILGEGATEEQITNTLNALHNQTNALNQTINDLKAQNSKYSDYDSIKSKLDEIERAKLSEQDKLELAKKEAADTLAKANKIYYTAKAKEILAGLEDDEDIISTVIGTTEEETINKATKLANRYRSIQDSVSKKTKEDLANLNVNPNMPNDDPNKTNVMDFEKFRSMSIEEQNKFANEHPEEFANL